VEFSDELVVDVTIASGCLGACPACRSTVRANLNAALAFRDADGARVLYLAGELEQVGVMFRDGDNANLYRLGLLTKQWEESGVPVFRVVEQPPK
jgi:hypothetical protein